MKNKILRLAAIALIFAFMLSLIACGKDDTPQTGDEKNTDAPIESGGSKSPAATIDPALYRQDEGVTRANIEVSSIGSISPMGGGKFACCSFDYDTNTTYISIYDVVTNEIVTTYDYEDKLLSLDGSEHDDGLLICRDYTNECCYIMDSADGKLERVDVPDVNALFARDCKSFYYLDRISYKIVNEYIDKSDVPMPVYYTWYSYASIDALSDDGKVIGKIYKSPFNYDYGISVYDFYEHNDAIMRNSMLGGSDSCTVNLSFNPYGISGVDVSGTENILVYNWEDSIRRVTLPSMEDTGIDFFPIMNSNYYMAVRYPMDESPDSEDHGEGYIYRYGETFDRIALSEYGIKGSITNFCNMKDEKLLVGFADAKDGISVIIVDPMRCEFEIQSDTITVDDVAAIEDNVAVANFYEAIPEIESNKYDELRKRANEIGARFTVGIAIANQSFTVFENMDEFELLHSNVLGDRELECISNALDTLERVLSQYPDDFFFEVSRLTDSLPVFALFGGVSNDVGSIAFAQEIRSTQCIALDVNGMTSDDVVYHEIWHAVENTITLVDPYAFSDEVWSEFNPDGFEYYNDLTSYYTETDSGEYTYYGDKEDGVYFVEAYSRCNAKEDRAKIMEYVMASPEQAAKMLEYEPLRAKLDYMAKRIRNVFDLLYETPPVWELALEGQE